LAYISSVRNAQIRCCTCGKPGTSGLSYAAAARRAIAGCLLRGQGENTMKVRSAAESEDLLDKRDHLLYRFGSSSGAGVRLRGSVIGGGSLENQHLTRGFKERRMQPRLPNCLSAAFVACILLLAPAQAQVSLFTQGQGLSPEDNRLLFDSIARLNGTQPARAGNSNTWSNPQSNDSGTNTVLRVFRSGGMACHLVQHHIVTGGTGRDYRLTWCRTSSGEWKIKA